MKLQAILEHNELKDRNRLIRRAFAPYSEPIEVSGFEKQVLCILLNLARKRNEQDDLLDEKAATEILRTDSIFERCVNEVSWCHTHNLKYPDCRVSHQRIIAQVVGDAPGIHSGHYPQRLGWSHNSNAINLAKPLISSFLWQGKLTSLAHLLKGKQPVWIKLLRAQGLPPSKVKRTCNLVETFLLEQDLPDLVSPYSTQIRLPRRSGYLSLSPVVSHIVQAEIQRLAFKKALSVGSLNHGRSASVGDLAGSLGGKVRALKYFPSVKNSHTLSEYYQQKSDSSLFLPHVLKKSSFRFAVSVLVGDVAFNTRHQKFCVLRDALTTLRENLTDWLSPLLRAKHEIHVKPDELGHYPRFIQLVKSEESLPTCIRDINNELQKQMSSIEWLSQYSYHPYLIMRFKILVKSVLSKTDCSVNRYDAPEICYLHLKNIRCNNSEAMPNAYLMGMPSLTALYGFSHKFEHNLQQKIPGIHVLGCAQFIRHYSLNYGKQIPEMQVVQVRKGQWELKGNGIIDKPKSDFTMDLVIRVHIDMPELLSKLSAEYLKVACPSRFGGGTLLPPELHDTSDWLSIYRSHDDLYHELIQLPASGCWIYPISEQPKTLEQLSTLLNQEESYRPAGIGFAFLETPRQREGALSDCHCYAEPILGVVECVNAIHVRLNTSKNFFRSAFWAESLSDLSILMIKSPFGVGDESS